MKERMNIGNTESRIYKAMNEVEKQHSTFELEPKLMEMIKMRVSQLNGCGYCINMHSKDARKLGETEQRLYALSAWWETPFFTETEQAALKLAEEVTLISEGGALTVFIMPLLTSLMNRRLPKLSSLPWLPAAGTDWPFPPTWLPKRSNPS